MSEMLDVLFSGGKDSTVCVDLLLKAGLKDRIRLLWVDTGASTTEQRNAIDSYINKVAEVVILKGRQPDWIETMGFPSDLVPSDMTATGTRYCGGDFKICDKYACCNANLWAPVNEYLEEHSDVHKLVVGDKACDKRISFKQILKMKDGREIIVNHPVLFWTDEMVRNYLLKNNLWQDRFALDHSSIDCWNCTAYWESLRERIDYLKKTEPELGDALQKLSRSVVGHAKKTISIIEEL